MTSQEIFDKIVTHLRIQNRRAIDFTGCRYRGPEGTKCAMGCLIPDDVYTPAMERRLIDDLISRWTVELGHLALHQDLLRSLQRVHDSYEVEDWETHFAKIASRYDLMLSPPVTT